MPAAPPGAGGATIARPAVAMLARSPRTPGKSRLTSHLTEAAAGSLRAALLLDTIAAVLGAGWPLYLFVTPAADVRVVADLIANDATLATQSGHCHAHEQGDGDLGARMADAMQRTLAAGHDVVVLVGSDLPALDAAPIVDAVATLGAPGLERHVVFGPARDGGFYLVASRRACAEAFTGATWSHGSVLEETEARAVNAGLTVSHVRRCDDVDTCADLQLLLATAPASAAPRTRAWAARHLAR